MIHPFHPLAGRDLQLVTCRQTWGEQRAYFYDDDGRLVSVPLLWTTLAAVDPLIEFAGGRSAFRVEDLLNLRDLLAAVGGQSS
ncbi:MAG: DUF5372 family protein [Planctomycetota bacterium]|nr:DUF5372 family protein [Planctomycetota bacterium]